ncbi:PRC-barrel domain-containing protein [Mesorhizobium caraganae]|uniref:PRC-barrel domain-containing protein n=1 Tax=Mesorhizobium caraganae TaxID=483206 RepID=UPI003337D904
MTRNLLVTTALAILTATGAYAQQAAAPAPAQPTAQAPAPQVSRAEGSLVTNIIGESVYNGTGDNAENIGKATDVVFDSNGQAKSVVIGVGGFLGIGTKNVAFDYSKLQWAEKNGDRWLVAQTTKDELKAQPDFDRVALEPAASNKTSTNAQNGPATAAAMPLLATDINGKNVYNGTGDDAQKIGDVNDIVLAKDGKAKFLVIGVGGFLGIGEKNVAFDLAKAKWAEKNGNRWVVVQTTKEEMQAQPDFDRKAYDPAPATTASNNAAAPVTTVPAVEPGKTAPKPAATTTATDQTKTGSIDKSTLKQTPIGEIRAEDFVGTTVYGANDANVGEIGDVVLNGDKRVDAVIIDVGGFLGIGEKEVAVGMDNLKFMTDKNGKRYLYTNFTKEQLEAQAGYDKGTYAQKRDEQRMILR